MIQQLGPWGVTFENDDEHRIYGFNTREKAEAFIAAWPGRGARLWRLRVEMESVEQPSGNP